MYRNNIASSLQYLLSFCRLSQNITDDFASTISIYQAYNGTLQIHIQETDEPVRLPVQLAGRWGQMNWNSVRREKKYFGIGPTRAAKAGQKYIVRARQAQGNNQRRTSFIWTLPIYSYLSFNSQQGLVSLLPYHSGRIVSKTHRTVCKIAIHLSGVEMLLPSCPWPVWPVPGLKEFSSAARKISWHSIFYKADLIYLLSDYYPERGGGSGDIFVLVWFGNQLYPLLPTAWSLWLRLWIRIRHFQNKSNPDSVA